MLDEAVRELERAVTTQPDLRHLDMLRALRSLRDPALKPFFSQLTTSPDPSIQIHAILGLAEISELCKVDPWLVSRLGGERERTAAIREAIALDLLASDGIGQMLAWDDLQDAPRLLLLSELHRLGEPVDAAILERLASHADDAIALLAGGLLMEVSGADRSAEFDSRLAALTPAARADVTLRFLQDAARLRLKSLAPWIRSLLDAGTLDALSDLAAVAALLQLDASSAFDLLQARVAAGLDHTMRVRYALLLLESTQTAAAPAELFEALRDGDALLDRIAALGGALSRGEDAAPAMVALIEADHWLSSARVLEIARTAADETRSLVFSTVIGRVGDGSAPPGIAADRGALAAVASALLAEDVPAELAGFLEGAPDDSRAQEAILIGLLNSPPAADERLAEALRGIRRIGSGRADSLALILVARDAASGALAAEDMVRLGRVATGGGRVAEPHMIQAAWLYVRHFGKTDLAVARLFAD
jgi:hypothetical protein